VPSPDADPRRTPARERANGRETGVERIAVLRANALGDLVFALPALDALRAAYPQAEISLLGRPLHAELLLSRPSPVDRVVVVPEADGVPEPTSVVRDPQEVEAFFAAQQRVGYDIALQLHGGGRTSNPFVRRLGARLTAGLRTPDAPPLDRWVRYVYFQPEIARYIEVVALVGADRTITAPTLAVTEQDRADAALVLDGDGDATPLAVLHPGASDGRRRWPPARFAAVGDALAARGVTIAITGTASERALVESVVAAMGAPARPLLELSLPALVGVLEHARLVVSNDTGPLHLATAVGTATVGIYWGGNLVNGAPPWRANHRPLASFRIHCPVCGVDCMRDSCEHDASFVADVQVQDVAGAALDLMDDRAPADR
jgi:ADP-heptose:LPS heptosyltransferase